MSALDDFPGKIHVKLFFMSLLSSSSQLTYVPLLDSFSHNESAWARYLYCLEIWCRILRDVFFQNKVRGKLQMHSVGSCFSLFDFRSVYSLAVEDTFSGTYHRITVDNLRFETLRTCFT